MKRLLATGTVVAGRVVLDDVEFIDGTQLERIQALDAFEQGRVAVLIGTDVAARGLDIDQLPMVINYEIPRVPEDYVHRIVRTAPASASGTAISLVFPEEETYLTEIEKPIKCEIKRAAAIVPQKTTSIERALRDKYRERSDTAPSAHPMNPPALPPTTSRQNALPPPINQKAKLQRYWYAVKANEPLIRFVVVAGYCGLPGLFLLLFQ